MSFSIDDFKKIDLDKIWQFNGDIHHLASYGWQKNDESLRTDDLVYYGYINGFKSAADLLVEKGSCPDSDVFPVIFCYRHYFELLLKHVYQGHVDVTTYIRELRFIGHDLKRLWKKTYPFIKDYLKELGMRKEDRKKFLNFFETLIKKIVELDQSSFNFRYPKDRQLNDSLPMNELIVDLPRLKEAVEAIDTVMYGVYGL